MTIKENLTNRNRKIAEDRQIKYIVVHNVGAVSTAIHIYTALAFAD